jgi:ribose 1,5-bisphosphokinase
MAGRLVGVVGPSGVGKDSVMRALAEACPDVRLVRRVITRPSDAGGEEFDGVSEAEFARREAAGEFALSWAAHGLRYGVPVTVEAELTEGHICLVNLSRSVLKEAQARFEGFMVLHLTAPQEVLARRLSARGREGAEAIEGRLSRADFALPDGLSDVVHIANDGALPDTVARVLAVLHPARV